MSDDILKDDDCEINQPTKFESLRVFSLYLTTSENSDIRKKETLDNEVQPSRPIISRRFSSTI